MKKIEQGFFSSSLEYHEWYDVIPEGTAVIRDEEADWISPLEIIHRYLVPEGTTVVRIENDEEVPEGFIYPCEGIVSDSLIEA